MKTSRTRRVPRTVGSISTPDAAKRTSKLSGMDSLAGVLDRMEDTFATRVQDFDDCFSFHLLWLKELKEVLVDHDFDAKRAGTLPSTPTQDRRRKEGLASGVRLPLSPSVSGCASGPTKRAVRTGKENGIRQPSFTPPPNRRAPKEVLQSPASRRARAREAAPLPPRLFAGDAAAKPSPLRHSTKPAVHIDTPASGAELERKQQEQMQRQMELVQRLYAENKTRAKKPVEAASSPKKHSKQSRSPRSPKPKMKLKARVLGIKPKSPAGSPLKKTRKHASAMASSTSIGRASLVAADLGTIIADTAANVVASNTGGSRPSFGRAYANALDRRLQRESISNTEKTRLAIKRDVFLHERTILASPEKAAQTLEAAEPSDCQPPAVRTPLSPQEKQRLRAAKKALHRGAAGTRVRAGPPVVGRALSEEEVRIPANGRSEEREVRADPYANMITPSVIRPQTPRGHTIHTSPEEERVSEKGRNKRMQPTVPKAEPGPKRVVGLSPRSRRRTLGQLSEEETVDLSDMSAVLKEAVCERSLGPAVTNSGEWTFLQGDGSLGSEGAYFESLSGLEDEEEDESDFEQDSFYVTQPKTPPRVAEHDLQQDSFYVTQTKTPPPSRPTRDPQVDSNAAADWKKSKTKRTKRKAQPIRCPRAEAIATQGPPAHILSPIRNKRVSIAERRSTLRSASFLLGEECIPAALRPEESTPAAVAEVLAASLEGSKRLRQNNSGSFRFNPDELCPSIGNIEGVVVANRGRLIEEGVRGVTRARPALVLSPIKRLRSGNVEDELPSPRERRTAANPISTVLSPEEKRTARTKLAEENTTRERNLLGERERIKQAMVREREGRAGEKNRKVHPMPRSPAPTSTAGETVAKPEFVESVVMIGQGAPSEKSAQSLSELVNRCYRKDAVQEAERVAEKERQHLQLVDSVKRALEQRYGPQIAPVPPGELLEAVQVHSEASADCIVGSPMARTLSEELGVKAFKKLVVAPERAGHTPTKRINTRAAAIALAHSAAEQTSPELSQSRQRKSLVFRGQTEEMLRQQQKNQFVSQQLYGLDKELAEKAAAKIDRTLANQLCLWMWYVAGADTDPAMAKDQLRFPDCLKSGKLLCAVANKIRPGVVRNVNKRPIALLERENIKFYLSACQHLGLRSHELFNISDLYEEKYLPSVVHNIDALARAARHAPSFPGPQFRK